MPPFYFDQQQVDDARSTALDDFANSLGDPLAPLKAGMAPQPDATPTPTPAPDATPGPVEPSAAPTPVPAETPTSSDSLTDPLGTGNAGGGWDPLAQHNLPDPADYNPGAPPAATATPQPAGDFSSSPAPDAAPTPTPTPTPTPAPTSGTLDRPSQFALGLSDAEAYAACGPAAAIAFARANGRNPTAEEAIALARQVGWTPEQGMAGPQSEVALLGKMGVSAHLESGVDLGKIAGGQTAIISTPGHYFTVDGYDADTSTFHVGTSGTDLKGGSQWMTLDQMQARMGKVQGTIYLDSTPQGAPAPQQPSSAQLQPTDKADQHVVQWQPIIDQVAGESGVPSRVLAALMEIETHGNPTSQSKQGANGLMQVVGGSMDPLTNVRQAAQLILEKQRDFHIAPNDWQSTAAAYFGAYNPQRGITADRDANGTSGYDYVSKFNDALTHYGGGGSSSSGSSAPTNPVDMTPTNSFLSDSQKRVGDLLGGIGSAVGGAASNAAQSFDDFTRSLGNPLDALNFDKQNPQTDTRQQPIQGGDLTSGTSSPLKPVVPFDQQPRNQPDRFDLTPALQVDPNSPLGKAVVGNQPIGTQDVGSQVEAGRQLVGGYEAARDRGISAINPAEHVQTPGGEISLPVIGGAATTASVAADPLTYALGPEVGAADVAVKAGLSRVVPAAIADAVPDAVKWAAEAGLQGGTFGAAQTAVQAGATPADVAKGFVGGAAFGLGAAGAGVLGSGAADFLRRGVGGESPDGSPSPVTQARSLTPQEQIEAQTLYRQVALRTHPDVGGEPEAFKAAATAYQNGDLDALRQQASDLGVKAPTPQQTASADASQSWFQGVKSAVFDLASKAKPDLSGISDLANQVGAWVYRNGAADLGDRSTALVLAHDLSTAADDGSRSAVTTALQKLSQLGDRVASSPADGWIQPVSPEDAAGLNQQQGGQVIRDPFAPRPEDLTDEERANGHPQRFVKVDKNRHAIVSDMPAVGEAPPERGVRAEEGQPPLLAEAPTSYERNATLMKAYPDAVKAAQDDLDNGNGMARLDQFADHPAAQQAYRAAYQQGHDSTTLDTESEPEPARGQFKPGDSVTLNIGQGSGSAGGRGMHQSTPATILDGPRKSPIGTTEYQVQWPGKAPVWRPQDNTWQLHQGEVPAAGTPALTPEDQATVAKRQELAQVVPLQTLREAVQGQRPPTSDLHQALQEVDRAALQQREAGLSSGTGKDAQLVDEWRNGIEEARQAFYSADNPTKSAEAANRFQMLEQNLRGIGEKVEPLKRASDLTPEEHTKYVLPSFVTAQQRGAPANAKAPSHSETQTPPPAKTQGYAKVGRFANAKATIAPDGTISVTGTLKPYEGWEGDQATKTLKLSDWQNASGNPISHQRQLLTQAFAKQLAGPLTTRGGGGGWDHLVDAGRSAINDAIAKREGHPPKQGRVTNAEQDLRTREGKATAEANPYRAVRRGAGADVVHADTREQVARFEDANTGSPKASSEAAAAEADKRNAQGATVEGGNGQLRGESQRGAERGSDSEQGAQLPARERPARQARPGRRRPVRGLESTSNPAAGVEPDSQRPAAPRSVGSGDAGSGPDGLAPNRDYRLTPADEAWAEKTPAGQRFEANIDAIRRVKDIQATGRPATEEDRAVFARFSGMGDSAFNDAFPLSRSAKPNQRLVALGEELKQLLGEREYDSLMRSRINAFFTNPSIVNAMWDTLKRIGAESLPSLRVLEPSAGSGRFIALMPPDLHDRSQITAVEMDLVTGEMLKHLFPESAVHVSPFQRLDLEAPGAVPDGSQDIAISNVPFGNIRVADPAYRGQTNITSAVHNYYFAKALDKVRPGGIVAFITSHMTFDARSEGRADFRRYLADRADLLGAVRLPQGAFPDTAVTTDILFFRKYDGGAKGASNPDWLRTEDRTFTDETGKEVTVSINQYFLEHPEQALGEHAVSRHSTSGGGRQAGYILKGDKGDALAEQLRDRLAKLPEGALRPATSYAKSEATIAAEKAVEGSFVEHSDGTLRTLRDGELRPAGRYVERGSGANKTRTWAPYTPDQVARIRAMATIHDLGRKVLDVQRSGLPEQQQKLAQAELKRAYDQFVRANGPLHLVSNRSLFASDPRSYWLRSLENWDEDLAKQYARGNKPSSAADLAKLHADIFSKNLQSAGAEVQTAATPKDALYVVLNERAALDFGRMAELLGRPADEIAQDLYRQELIYRNPAAGGEWEMADEYLSGKVKQKLAEAEKAARSDPAYQANVKALEKVIPADVPPHEIGVSLGSPWVPEKDVNQFVRETLFRSNAQGDEHQPVHLQRTSDSATWHLSQDPRDMRYLLDYGKAQDWGTDRIGALGILENALNSRTISIKDNIGTSQSPHYVLNEEETRAANGKARALKAEFVRWLWSDADRAERLMRLYNDTFNDTVLWNPDGSHLSLPGSNPNITLRPHQLAGVWRAIRQPSLLLAHEVGFGKSMTMAAAAMELKRLGLSKRTTIVVPNHLVGQMASEFYKLYPQANLLVPAKADYEAGNRATLMARIATGDWDSVIVPQSQFKLLPVHPATALRFAQQMVDDINAVIRAYIEANPNAEKDKDPTLKELVKKAENAVADLQDRSDKLRAYQADAKHSLAWDELGVDALMVDEADQYKNLQFFTTRTRIKGLPNSKSDRAFDMYMKSRILLEQHGRGLVFATGTPISNTIAELWTMLRYLAPKTLEDLHLGAFDAWASTYGDSVEAIEQTVTGKRVPVERFAQFKNAPELSRLFQSVADIRMAEDSPEMEAKKPRLRDGKRIAIELEPTEWHAQFVQGLEQRAEALKHRRGKPQKGDDNMLAITGDAKKASLDPQLVHGPDLGDKGKIGKTAEIVANELARTAADRGTVAVFLDMGTPKSTQGVALKDLPKPLQEEIKKARSEAGAAWDTTEQDNLIQAYFAANDLGDPAEQAAQREVYRRLKAKIVARGVPEHEIAFIHDAKNDAQKQELFRQVNAGEKRVLIGSTEKMGAGSNFQERLAALIHMDTPWRPRDLEQREGRILRPGNKVYGPPTDERGNTLKDSKGQYLPGPGVNIYQLVTKWPFDEYLWSLLLSKLRAIKSFMRRDVTARTVSDVDEVVLSYEEMKAIASGDPLTVKLLGIEEELKQLEAERSSYQIRQSRAEGQVKSLPGEIAIADRDVAQVKADQKSRDRAPADFRMQVDGNTFTKRPEAGQPLLDAIQRAMRHGTTWTPIGLIKGFEIAAREPYDGAAQLRIYEPGKQNRDGSGQPRVYYASNAIYNADLIPTGVVARVEGLLRQIDNRAVIEGANGKELREKLAGLQRSLKQPFTGQQRLEQLQKARDLITRKQNGDEGITDEQIAEVMHGAPALPTPEQTEQQTDPAAETMAAQEEDLGQGLNTAEQPEAETEPGYEIANSNEGEAAEQPEAETEPAASSEIASTNAGQEAEPLETQPEPAQNAPAGRKPAQRGSTLNETSSPRPTQAGIAAGRKPKGRQAASNAPTFEPLPVPTFDATSRAGVEAYQRFARDQADAVLAPLTKFRQGQPGYSMVERNRNYRPTQTLARFDHDGKRYEVRLEPHGHNPNWPDVVREVGTTKWERGGLAHENGSFHHNLESLASTLSRLDNVQYLDPHLQAIATARQQLARSVPQPTREQVISDAQLATSYFGRPLRESDRHFAYDALSRSVMYGHGAPGGYHVAANGLPVDYGTRAIEPGTLTPEYAAALRTSARMLGYEITDLHEAESDARHGEPALEIQGRIQPPIWPPPGPTPAVQAALEQLNGEGVIPSGEQAIPEANAQEERQEGLLSPESQTEAPTAVQGPENVPAAEAPTIQPERQNGTDEISAQTPNAKPSSHFEQRQALREQLSAAIAREDFTAATDLSMQLERLSRTNGHTLEIAPEGPTGAPPAPPSQPPAPPAGPTPPSGDEGNNGRQHVVGFGYFSGADEATVQAAATAAAPSRIGRDEVARMAQLLDLPQLRQWESIITAGEEGNLAAADQAIRERALAAIDAGIEFERNLQDLRAKQSVPGAQLTDSEKLMLADSTIEAVRATVAADIRAGRRFSSEIARALQQMKLEVSAPLARSQYERLDDLAQRLAAAEKIITNGHVPTSADLSELQHAAEALEAAAPLLEQHGTVDQVVDRLQPENPSAEDLAQALEVTEPVAQLVADTPPAEQIARRLIALTPEWRAARRAGDWEKVGQIEKQRAALISEMERILSAEVTEQPDETEEQPPSQAQRDVEGRAARGVVRRARAELRRKLAHPETEREAELKALNDAVRKLVLEQEISARDLLPRSARLAEINEQQAQARTAGDWSRVGRLEAERDKILRDIHTELERQALARLEAGGRKFPNREAAQRAIDEELGRGVLGAIARRVNEAIAYPNRPIDERMARLHRNALRSADRQQINDLAAKLRGFANVEHRPGATAQQLQGMEETLQQLQAISQAAAQRGSRVREGLFRRGLKSYLGKNLPEDRLNDLTTLLMTADPNDPSSVGAIMRGLRKPTIWDKLKEYTVVNLLTSPMTWGPTGINFMSNSAMIAGHVLVSMPLDALHDRLRYASDRHIFAREIPELLKGMASPAGFQRSWRLAWENWKNGNTADQYRVAAETGDLRTVRREFLSESGLLGIPGVVFEWMHRFSTRPLESGDIFQGNMLYAGMANSLAYRKARKLLAANDPYAYAGPQGGLFEPNGEGGPATGPGRLLGVDELRDKILRNVWDHPDIMQEAGKVEQYTLFRAKPNRVFQALASIRNAGPGANGFDQFRAFLVQQLFPFVYVPFNTTAQQLSTSVPGAIYNGARYFREKDPIEQARRFRLAMIGAGLLGLGLALYAGDNLTGDGPTDPSKKLLWEQDHQRDSLRVGGHWLSYDGFPFALQLSMVANTLDNFHEAVSKSSGKLSSQDAVNVLSSAVGGGVLGAAQTVLNQPFLQQAKDWLDVLSGDHNPAFLVSGLASRWVPMDSMLAFLARAGDGVVRDVSTTTDRIANRIPVLHDALRPRLNPFGEEEPNEQQGLKALLPFRPADLSNDPTLKEYERLGVNIPKAPPSIQNVELTPDEQYAYDKLVGPALKQVTQKAMASAAWPRLSDQQKTIVLQKLVQQTRDQVGPRVLLQIGKDEVRRRLLLKAGKAA